MRKIIAMILTATVVGCQAAPSPAQTTQTSSCEPVRFVAPTPTMAPNSTYVSDSEPPARFSGPPTHGVEVYFGQANIDAICGQPPCGKHFLGCTSGNKMALMDPFTADGEQFMRILRHEIGHENGWPDTHGN